MMPSVWYVSSFRVYDKGWCDHVIFLEESGSFQEYIVEIDREPP